MNETDVFATERPRLVRIAARVLGDSTEAEDVVQQAWLRLDAHGATVENLPGWLTTVTTRLCLDQLRRRTPAPVSDEDLPEVANTEIDPGEQLALADTVGVALQVVLARLTPNERVAFVLHDSFSIDFVTIAEILATTPDAARKLASRARAKLAQPASHEHQPDWEVVDAFLAAARNGDFERLITLLAPDAAVHGDEAAVAQGTPERIDGRRAVATMFDGAAKSAVPVFIQGRPGAAWLHRGQYRVAFDFTVVEGIVFRIDFRAAPAILSAISRRRGSQQT